MPGNQIITHNGWSVTVTSDFRFSKIDQRVIVETVKGWKDLHKTTSASNCPADSIGYIHNEAENTLYAVSAMDSTAMTITITKSGQAQTGSGGRCVHQFK